MHFFDFGESYSPDGRAHPVDAFTPVVASFAPSTAGDCSQYAVGSLDWQRCQAKKDVGSMIAGSSAPASGGSGPTPDPSSGGGIIGKIASAATGMDSHTPARIALGVLAIGILIVVAIRLTK
jgi:hypothetical protein